MDSLEVWQRFERARLYRRIADVLLIAGTLVLFLLVRAEMWLTWALVVGLVLALAGTVMALTFWRCPVCKGLLPARDVGVRLRHCPRCGVNLDE